MKKNILIALLGAALAIPFSAQAAGGYVGVNFGQSRHDFDDAGLRALSRDEKDNAWKIYGGFEFNKTWGVEVGYADFGNLRNTYTVGTLNAKSRGVYTAGTVTLPLGEHFSLFGKLGVTANHSSASGPAGSVSGNQGSLMGGVGAAFNITKNIAVAVEYENFGKVAEDAKVEMVSVGVRYKF